MSPKRAPFEIGSAVVAPGTRGETELGVARLVTGSPLSLPLLVLHGASEGPTIWMNAAIHGDEINGVEIIRQVLETVHPKTLRGTVMAVPVVNVPGFMTGDRYLPDRRDLNRSFPGSQRGSLAGKIAHLLMSEVAARCSVGIDLHTGSDSRTNLPQIRADLDDPDTERLALAFGAPLMLHASTRDGSLRRAGTKQGVTMLLFEGGQASRFDADAIRVGVAGVLGVLRKLDMIDAVPPGEAIPHDPVHCRGSSWVRARSSGIAQIDVGLGDTVERRQPLGRIHDTFGRRLSRINAAADGIVIGLSLTPLVNHGDAVVHIAQPVGTSTVSTKGESS